MEYTIPPLDNGAIGNGQVLALVAPTTRIEWLCLPRFDSPSVFGSLLDPDQGGSFSFEPADAGARTEMAYVANTNVLRTRVTASDGVFDIFDYAPRVPAGARVETPLEIHRLLVPREGHVHVRVRFDPRTDYARVVPEIVEVAHGLDMVSSTIRLFLRSNVPAPYLRNGCSIRIDEPLFFILSCGRPTDLDSISSVRHVLDQTIHGWRAWAKSCALPSFAEREVLRSALCLKLHVFEETGAIIAAATTSIPEPQAPNARGTIGTVGFGMPLSSWRRSDVSAIWRKVKRSSGFSAPLRSRARYNLSTGSVASGICRSSTWTTWRASPAVARSASETLRTYRNSMT